MPLEVCCVSIRFNVNYEHTYIGLSDHNVATLPNRIIFLSFPSLVYKWLLFYQACQFWRQVISHMIWTCPSIHFSETTKYRYRKKSFEYVYLIQLSSLTNSWNMLIRRFFVISHSHSLPFASNLRMPDHLHCSFFLTLMRKRYCIAICIFCKQYEHHSETILTYSGAPMSAPAIFILKLIRTHTRWQYWNCIRWSHGKDSYIICHSCHLLGMRRVCWSCYLIN